MHPSSSTAALEAELSPELRWALREGMELLECGREWSGAREMRLFETLAVARRTRVIQIAKGCAWETALGEACTELGVGLSAMKMRFHRASQNVTEPFRNCGGSD